MAASFLNHADVDMELEPWIYEKASKLPGYTEADELMIHYTVTEDCPFSCRGCINRLTAAGEKGKTPLLFPTEGQEDLARDIKGIANLIEQSGKGEAVIVCYGGEPMVRLETMNALYEQIPRAVKGSAQVRFMVITSGHYLQRAARQYPDLAANMWLTAVSVDGLQEQHDAVRLGTSLVTIRRQLAHFKRVRRGDVVIWSTLRPGMSLLDCFESFMHFHRRGEAEHFFWHLDEAEGRVPNLEEYLLSYQKDLDRIMEAYLAHLEKGELLSIVHLNDLMLYLLTKKRRGTSACAVERMANFDITRDGRIHACADLPRGMSIGRIDESGEAILREDAKDQLGGIVAYKDALECGRCGVEPYCGGRCPVQANTGGIGRAMQYCFMMRGHVKRVKQDACRIVDLMLKHHLTLEDLYRSGHYTKFTDVTP